ncbi:hypothetical protein CVT26_008927 [Gymnopilus dilepis]|uniref:Uncharacterized protein n=1 Tax=Gymnopilus dilepis TaxID=231916 RepID=A0A409WUP6_9AGAR|nr:hypothetical protein CVT26_008927 [Gymnopilus dilepis]
MEDFFLAQNGGDLFSWGSSDPSIPSSPSPAPLTALNLSQISSGLGNLPDENSSPIHGYPSSDSSYGRHLAPQRVDALRNSNFQISNILRCVSDEMLMQSCPAYQKLAVKNMQLATSLQTQRYSSWFFSESKTVNERMSAPAGDPSSQENGQMTVTDKARVDSSLQLPFSPINREDFKLVDIWTREDWASHPKNPVNQNTDASLSKSKKKKKLKKDDPCPTLLFVQSITGESINCGRGSDLRREARSLFEDFARKGMMSEKFLKMSQEALYCYRKTLYDNFPELRYCEGHWKAEALGILTYPSWKKNYLIGLERAAGGQVKVEKSDDEDDDELLGGVHNGEESDELENVRKRRGSTPSAGRPDKRSRSDETVPNTIPSQSTISTPDSRLFRLVTPRVASPLAQSTLPPNVPDEIRTDRTPIEVADRLSDIGSLVPQQGDGVEKDQSVQAAAACPNDAEKLPSSEPAGVSTAAQTTPGTAATTPEPPAEQADALAEADGAAPETQALTVPDGTLTDGTAVAFSRAVNPTTPIMAAERPVLPPPPTKKEKTEYFKYSDKTTVAWNLFGREYMAANPNAKPLKAEIRTMYNALSKEEKKVYNDQRKELLNVRKVAA